MRTMITGCGISLVTTFCLLGCSPGGQVNAAAPPAMAAEATGASGAKDDTVATLAKECLGCHAQAISLADVPASEMPGAIRSVIAGKVAHPTVVPKLTDDQVVELARLLQQP